MTIMRPPQHGRRRAEVVRFRRRIVRDARRGRKQLAGEREAVLARAACKQAVVADAMEAARQDVEQEAADAGDFGGFLNRAMELPRRDRIGATAPRKQPAMRKHHPATPAFAPPQPQQFQQLRREHGVAILASFALFDADQHACAVDIIDLEVRDLRWRRPAP